MLIDWVWLSQIGRYLALGHGTRTSLCSVRTSWPRPEYFPSGPPTQSVSTYFFCWNLWRTVFWGCLSKTKCLLPHFTLSNPKLSKEKLLKAFMPAMLYFFIFWKEPLQQWCSTLSTPPLPVFPLLVFNKRLHTCRYRLCRFLILFMINRFMWLYFYFKCGLTAIASICADLGIAKSYRKISLIQVRSPRLGSDRLINALL